MEETKAPAELPPSEDWAQLPWRKLEQYVYRLQKRIYKASSRGNVQAVHRLQQLLMRSRAARLIAVRRVTQDNQGKKTAGVDGVASVSAPHRLALVDRIHPTNWRKPQPVRRVWIPKPGKPEKRPLGIPTMRDRACQALAKLALEPEWEAQFEPNSYGFRPGRSCHDALEAIFLAIRKQPKYVLDADIQGCFDHINHQALLGKLSTYPTMRQAVRAWLRAGVLEEGQMSPTEEGTPQGGVISPLLANIALHGLETTLTAAYGASEGRPHVVRYADDFVVFHPTLTGVLKAQRIVADWLKGMGLDLHPNKTRITHTLVPYQGARGFEFLGTTIRQVPVGQTHTGTTRWGHPLGHKTLITPSKDAVKHHVRELGHIVRAHQTATQAALIGHLNPVIRGWTNYHRTVVSGKTFSRCDYLLYEQLRRWARRRHPNKSGTWVSNKYWTTGRTRRWTFAAPDGKVLKQHETTHITRHVKVRGTASPFDGNLIYWAKRLQDHPLTTNRTGYLLRRQQGRCWHCGLFLKEGDLLEVDHILPAALGGKDEVSNLQVLHRHCHDQKTAQDGSTRTRRQAV